MLKFIALQGAPYIYDISRLRVNSVIDTTRISGAFFNTVTNIKP
jgi:hypothetical protein